MLAADIVARQAAGHPAPGPSTPPSTAGLLIAAADGLQTQWLLDPEVDMAAHLSSLVSLLCSAPAPAPASARHRLS